ncbi:GNAT family N-acetyltransferase [Subsaximicrobium wynnwilliamsii]|uniref:GNAT family N-acetyltransferase n=1 Tax=Subsaximicrobium wynnwilliamsii TaxID=291179 RepID=A0A5C6ZK01_9FLAO|nr:GNAT family N-acetyltransferase [Subsaximicrobium wynnwilliamsii]TXD84604.1 GNAT family N-acetyltransferase [Subsaximicrobium wynnwilliamsii]TXD90286.1 GNAT family N-acetyltransferase [Subsaximicrobium wynnwilliamsii]TXE04337.1 GNAT family N-acetyltransferase [Subsaximicrobium wynnwilliamsii]
MDSKIINETFFVKDISAKDTYAVRHPVLRAGKPMESCVFSNDDLETTFHYGLLKGSKLIGVASYFKNGNASFSEVKQYQLRGMAILENFQGQKLGDLLLKETEQMMALKSVARIWCNARVSAAGFYTKNGYSIIGTAFEIPEVGMHYVMTKVV